jgi:two-component system, OmpR family, response regulator VicR
MNITILFYDDDEEILHITQKLLERKGFSVCCQSNTAHLFLDIEKQQPAIILMDLSVGPDGGRGAVIKIKSNLLYAHIPVAIVSGDAFIAEAAKNCGADGFIEKPFTTNELITLIQQLAGISPEVTGIKVL